MWGKTDAVNKNTAQVVSIAGKDGTKCRRPEEGAMNSSKKKKLE